MGCDGAEELGEDDVQFEGRVGWNLYSSFESQHTTRCGFG